MKNNIYGIYALRFQKLETCQVWNTESNKTETRVVGLGPAYQKLHKLFPEMSQKEIVDVLTNGERIEGLTFENAMSVKSNLYTYNPQYVISKIELTISISEALSALSNRPARGEIQCNNQWGKLFIKTPFAVISWIIQNEEVHAEPFAEVLPSWSARRDGHEVKLTQYPGGTMDVEYSIQYMQGITRIKGDLELMFLVRKAIEEIIGKEEERETLEMFREFEKKHGLV